MLPMAHIPDITLYSALSGEKIAHGSPNNELWQSIKNFKNVSKRNPIKISFIPKDTDITLEFFEDLICSPYGTEFLVIYHQITLEEYKLLYCKLNSSKCPNEDYFDEYPYIPETCLCSYCVCANKRIQSEHYRHKRINSYGL